MKLFLFISTDQYRKVTLTRMETAKNLFEEIEEKLTRELVEVFPATKKIYYKISQ